MRVRILKDNKLGKKGEVVEVTRNEGFGLIDSGFAMIDKSMTRRDVRTKRIG